MFSEEYLHISWGYIQVVLKKMQVCPWMQLDFSSTSGRLYPSFTGLLLREPWMKSGRALTNGSCRYYRNLHRSFSITLLSKAIPVTAARMHIAPSRSVQWACRGLKIYKLSGFSDMVLCYAPGRGRQRLEWGKQRQPQGREPRTPELQH